MAVAGDPEDASSVAVNALRPPLIDPVIRHVPPDGPRANTSADVSDAFEVVAEPLAAGPYPSPPATSTVPSPNTVEEWFFLGYDIGDALLHVLLAGS
ncbi:MAG TPA: hypothetical protein VM142_06030 [Acidimicrobiales bacterium]|nr:hypothetical protein [Acidimicrobiales bacterium]